METGDLILEAIKIIVPAGAVIFAVTIVLNWFKGRQEQKDRMEIRLQAVSQIVPLRLNAYERMILFLERISPEQILTRVPPANKTTKDYQIQLVREIRTEYDHNIAQQIYVSIEGWMQVVEAKEKMIALVTQCAKELGPDAPATNLGRRIIEKMVQEKEAPTVEAANALKDDIRKMFRL